MGVWILDGDVGGMDRSVLVDSVTERPFNVPAFESHEDAASFLTFCAMRADLPRAMDPTMSSALLDALHLEWVLLPRCVRCGDHVTAPGELPNECESCRPMCEWAECKARGDEVLKRHKELYRYCSAHAGEIRKQDEQVPR